MPTYSTAGKVAQPGGGWLSLVRAAVPRPSHNEACNKSVGTHTLTVAVQCTLPAIHVVGELHAHPQMLHSQRCLLAYFADSSIGVSMTQI